MEGLFHNLCEYFTSVTRIDINFNVCLTYFCFI